MGKDKLCCYDCGQKASHLFKNGKRCCSNNIMKCPCKKAIKKVVSDKTKKKISETRIRKFASGELVTIITEEQKKKISNTLKEKYANGELIMIITDEQKKRRSKTRIRRLASGKIIPPTLGKKTSDKTKKKISNTLKEKHANGELAISNKTKKKISNTLKEKYADRKIVHPRLGKKASDKTKKKQSETMLRKYASGEHDEFKKKISKYMLNGGAAHAASFAISPSKPQKTLYKLVKSIYPKALLEYRSLNYFIDIAIPNKMIAIEYDCWYWHQDKEKDKIRQNKLEKIGWQFLRYMDYIPTIDEFKKDLRQLT